MNIYKYSSKAAKKIYENYKILYSEEFILIKSGEKVVLYTKIYKKQDIYRKNMVK